MDLDLQKADGGIRSRKLWFAVFCVVTLLIAGKWLPTLAVGEVVMGIVGIALAYIGGNTATRWLSLRKRKKKAPKPEAEGA